MINFFSAFAHKLLTVEPLREKQSILVKLFKKLFQSFTVKRIFLLAQPEERFVIADTDEGLSYVISTSDLAVGRITLERRASFDCEIVESAFAHLAYPVDTLFDIGANIGSISLFCLKREYASRCVAFEPDPTNFKLLQVNSMLNEMQNKIEAHNIALSDGSTPTLELSLSSTNHGAHETSFSNPQDPQGSKHVRQTSEVPAARVDQFFNEETAGRAILWMDVQGFEGHVLKGATAMIAAKIPVVLEFDPLLLERVNGFEQLLDTLSASPYTEIIDLRNRTQFLGGSINDRLMRIAEQLSGRYSYTDLLLR